MHAAVGERIVVRSRRQGEPDRDGEVLEVRGPSGSPPYLVRWSANGHEGLYFPESDAVVHHLHEQSPGEKHDEQARGEGGA